MIFSRYSYTRHFLRRIIERSIMLQTIDLALYHLQWLPDAKVQVVIDPRFFRRFRHKIGSKEFLTLIIDHGKLVTAFWIPSKGDAVTRFHSVKTLHLY